MYASQLAKHSTWTLYWKLYLASPEKFRLKPNSGLLNQRVVICMAAFGRDKQVEAALSISLLVNLPHSSGMGHILFDYTSFCSRFGSISRGCDAYF